MVNVEFVKIEKRYGGESFRAIAYHASQLDGWSVIHDLFEADKVEILLQHLDRRDVKDIKVSGRIVINPFKTDKALSKQIKRAMELK
jgi:hypothetical protein